MSDQDSDKEFRKLVDSFIHLANQHIDTAKRETVGLALLYAAARFNAFVVASHAGDLQQFESDRGPASEYFMREYQRMLAENLDDHRTHFGGGGGKYAHLKTQH